MDSERPSRRAFLARMTAVAASGLASRSTSAREGPVAGGPPRYHPAAHFDIAVTEVEFRRNAAGRMLMARVYQPLGQPLGQPPGQPAAGAFPTVLDLHGGAWNAKNRTAEEPMDRALASSGVLVVAIDMTLAPEAPYPACVQDANYGVRWLKSQAAAWKGDPSTVGIFGSSSGGHVAELLAMRPRDARYNAIPLEPASGGRRSGSAPDATVAYVAMRSPVSNPLARFENAQRMKRDAMITNTTTFFAPWDTIHESNPQEILERHEKVSLVPLLIMQGALDDNVLPAIQEKFAATYKAAGGNCQYELFEGCEHEWVATPGPQTDRARAMVRAFIAKHVNA